MVSKIRPGVDRDFAERMFKMFARPFDPNWKMPDLDGPGYYKKSWPYVMSNTAGYEPGGNDTGAGMRQMKGDVTGGVKDSDVNGWVDPKGMFPGGGMSSTGGVTGRGTLDRYRTNEIVPRPDGAYGQGGDNTGGTSNASSDTGFGQYLGKMGMAESTNNYKARNQIGYLGKYQLGDAALADAGFYYDYLEDGGPKVDYSNTFQGKWTDKAKTYGVTSAEDFLNSSEAQEAAMREFSKRNWGYIRHWGLDKHIGKEINGVKITASGLLAAGHLGGIGGLRQLFGEPLGYPTDEDGVPVDGNRKPVTDYLRDMAGLDLTELVGYNPDKD